MQTRLQVGLAANFVLWGGFKRDGGGVLISIGIAVGLLPRRNVYDRLGELVGVAGALRVHIDPYQ